MSDEDHDEYICEEEEAEIDEEKQCDDRDCVRCKKTRSIECCIEREHGFPSEMNIINTVEWIREKYHIVTLLPTESIYTYHDGVYTRDGDQFPYIVLEKSFGNMRNLHNKGILSEKMKDVIVRKLKHQTYIEPYTELSPTKVPFFDKDLDTINMCNGLYNWRTGEFTEHTYKYPSQIQVAVKYDAKARCPTLDEIIKDVLKPSDVKRFYEAFAYSFYRAYLIQHFFLLFGEAGTGKSQLLDMLQNVVGSWNISHVTFEDLGGRNKNRFSPIKMFGKLLNVAGDLDATYIPEVGKVKMLCSGTDEIEGERKYIQDEFSFVNFAKTWYSANKLPEINEESDGFYRRANPFVCDVRFDIGGGKSERLNAIKDPYELSGLFNEAIGYLPDLLERKKFTGQLEVREVKALYKRSSNTIEEFLVERVEAQEGSFIFKPVLFDEYKKYCKKYKLAKLGNIYAFGKALRKAGFNYKDGSDYDISGEKKIASWKGCRLIE